LPAPFVARLFFSGPFDFQARSISYDAAILRGQWLALRRTTSPALRISTEDIPQCGLLLAMMAATIWPSVVDPPRF
jgi:hypothetical protein